MTTIELEIQEIAQQIKQETDKDKKLVLMDKLSDKMAIMFKPEAIQIVNMIESGIKTTKGNYGKYLQFLSGYTGITKIALYKALKDNGGDIYGIESAWKLMHHSNF